jgi:hypothetical protein
MAKRAALRGRVIARSRKLSRNKIPTVPTGDDAGLLSVRGSFRCAMSNFWSTNSGFAVFECQVAVQKQFGSKTNEKVRRDFGFGRPSPYLLA